MFKKHIIVKIHKILLWSIFFFQSFFFTSLQVGGYGLPFYVMGILILLNGALIYKFLPQIQGERLYLYIILPL